MIGGIEFPSWKELKRQLLTRRPSRISCVWRSHKFGAYSSKYSHLLPRYTNNVADLYCRGQTTKVVPQLQKVSKR